MKKKRVKLAKEPSLGYAHKWIVAGEKKAKWRKLHYSFTKPEALKKVNEFLGAGYSPVKVYKAVHNFVEAWVAE